MLKNIVLLKILESGSGHNHKIISDKETKVKKEEVIIYFNDLENFKFTHLIK